MNSHGGVRVAHVCRILFWFPVSKLKLKLHRQLNDRLYARSKSTLYRIQVTCVPSSEFESMIGSSMRSLDCIQLNLWLWRQYFTAVFHVFFPLNAFSSGSMSSYSKTTLSKLLSVTVKVIWLPLCSTTGSACGSFCNNKIHTWIREGRNMFYWKVRCSALSLSDFTRLQTTWGGYQRLSWPFKQIQCLHRRVLSSPFGGNSQWMPCWGSFAGQ